MVGTHVVSWVGFFSHWFTTLVHFLIDHFLLDLMTPCFSAYRWVSYDVDAIRLMTTPGSVDRSRPIVYEILEDTSISADYLYPSV